MAIRMDIEFSGQVRKYSQVQICKQNVLMTTQLEGSAAAVQPNCTIIPASLITERDGLGEQR